MGGGVPCGLGTTLLSAGGLQADAFRGAATMAAFGWGTLPVMLPLTWSGARIGQRLQRGGWRTATGVLVRTGGREIRGERRATQGVKLIGLYEGSQLSGLQRIVENDAARDDIDTSTDTETDSENNAGNDAANPESNS